MGDDVIFLVGASYGFRLNDVHHWTVDGNRTTVYFYNDKVVVVAEDLGAKFLRALKGEVKEGESRAS